VPTEPKGATVLEWHSSRFLAPFGGRHHVQPSVRLIFSAIKRRANRGALPTHLPRVDVTIEPEDINCPCCRESVTAWTIGRAQPRNPGQEIKPSGGVARRPLTMGRLAEMLRELAIEGGPRLEIR
jgi:hypothetical protein